MEDPKNIQLKKPLNIINMSKQMTGKSLSPTKLNNPSPLQTINVVTKTINTIQQPSSSRLSQSPKLADRVYNDIKVKISSTSPKHYNK